MSETPTPYVFLDESPTPPARRTYEYKPVLTSSVADITEMLRQYGSIGYHLVSTVAMWPSGVLLILEREVRL